MVGWEQISSMVGWEQISSMVGWEQISSMVGWEQISSMVGEEQISSMVGEEQISSMVGEEQISSMVGEEQISSMVAALLPTDLCRLVVVQVYGSSLGLWSQFSLHCSLETSHRHSFLLRDRERRGLRDARSSAGCTCVVYGSRLAVVQFRGSSLAWRA